MNYKEVLESFTQKVIDTPISKDEQTKSVSIDSLDLTSANKIISFIKNVIERKGFDVVEGHSRFADPEKYDPEKTIYIFFNKDFDDIRIFKSVDNKMSTRQLMDEICFVIKKYHQKNWNFSIPFLTDALDLYDLSSLELDHLGYFNKDKIFNAIDWILYPEKYFKGSLDESFTQNVMDTHKEKTEKEKLQDVLNNIVSFDTMENVLEYIKIKAKLANKDLTYSEKHIDVDKNDIGRMFIRAGNGHVLYEIMAIVDPKYNLERSLDESKVPINHTYGIISFILYSDLDPFDTDFIEIENIVKFNKLYSVPGLQIDNYGFTNATQIPILLKWLFDPEKYLQ